jgi:hypothetical protein
MQTSEFPAAVADLSRARLLWLTLAALALATLLFITLVLPAEYRIDPTGVGRASGLTRLAGAREVSAAAAATGESVATRYYATPYRSDFVDIPLGVTREDSELEYKVRMKAGQTLTYSWSVPGIGNPEEFYFDFHGEADKKGADGEAVVVEYLQATGTHSAGMLVAPFDGIFGWYVQNQSQNPVVVQLQVAGFYELIAPGEYGNSAAIRPNTKSGSN